VILHAPLVLLVGLFVLSISVAAPDAQIGPDEAVVPTQIIAFLR
jgi:hypothetical protein